MQVAVQRRSAFRHFRLCAGGAAQLSASNLLPAAPPASEGSVPAQTHPAHGPSMPQPDSNMPLAAAGAARMEYAAAMLTACQQV